LVLIEFPLDNWELWIKCKKAWSRDRC